MAEPAKRSVPDAPITDSRAIQREVRRQRAMREHRERRTRERRAANIRFWVILLALLVLSVYLGLKMWQQVQNLFGL
jgi:type VI protein secretion system component VasF